MLNNLKNKVKNYIIERIYKLIEDKIQLDIQMNEFINAPRENLSSYVESETNIIDLLNEFKDVGISVIEEKINIKDFQKWMEEYSEIVDYYNEHNSVKIEKILEHYLTCKYLSIKKGDVYIDIAACNSPFSKILRKRGIDGYEQDLIYEAGINQYKIGGDASSLPVPNNFANALSLQYAFECFQGDSDVGFIKESCRVLKKGGMLGIVPLYVDKKYFVKTGPRANKKNIKVEKEAKWIWRDDEYLQEPFSRHYSPAAVKSRIFDHLTGMRGEILFFLNLDELMKIYDNQRIYCYFMLCAIKQ